VKTKARIRMCGLFKVEFLLICMPNREKKTSRDRNERLIFLDFVHFKKKKDRRCAEGLAADRGALELKTTQSTCVEVAIQ